MKSYYHNRNIEINKENFLYVHSYKKQLLNSLAQLFFDLNIKYVISHGNLIEFERNKDIKGDDDIDIRFDKNDILKWKHFCDSGDFKKYNLELIVHSIFKKNFYSCCVKLIEFQDNIETFKNINIFCDIVINIIPKSACGMILSQTWINYDIDFNNIRKIKYLNTSTYAPSKEDTIRLLTKEYGTDYLIPITKYNIFKLFLHH